MRCWLLMGLLALANASPAAGQICHDMLKLNCPAADFPDTACVTVFIKNCDVAVDAFGFELLYQDEHLRFVRADRTHTLVEDWIKADAAIVPSDTNSRIRVGGYDLAGIAPGDERPLIRLLFLVITPFPFDSALVFDDASLTDDIVDFQLLGCVVPVPVDGRTWGAVKAMYE